MANSPSTGISPPPGVDPKVPNVARAYDYLLGGSNNFAADRDMAEKALVAVPELKQMAIENRALLRRAVNHLTRAGVRRFLDVGAGLPCQGQVHEVAQTIDPDVEVVYTDYDPMVVLQSQAMLVHQSRVCSIAGDVREPDAILAAPEVRALLEPGEPVALLLFSVMQFIPQDELAYGAVAALVDALPAGSYLALSHPTTGHRPDRMPRLAQVYENAADVAIRSPDHLARFFDGLELLEPGIVPVNEWRPDVPGTVDDHGWNMVGVARKPE